MSAAAEVAALPRRGRASPGRSRMLFLVFWACGGLLLVSIVAPLVALATLESPANVMHVAASQEVRAAIELSLAAAGLAALIAAALGFPLAYVLAHGDFPGKRVVEAVIDIPLAVPHTVAGIALLAVYGRRGLFGAALGAAFGLKFWGTLAGIVVGMLFVSAPFAVNAARIGFEAIDPKLEKVARTLGAGPWTVLARVTLPLAWRSLLTGVTLTFARAISEVGAVIILAYYPMTAPIKIYELFLRFGLREAAGMALLVLVIALGLFIALRYLASGRDPRAEARR
ncbi:MAG: ABC transporter permease [Betaproteobacteria bacterium]|nr:ABC transporter permease [Betaproteobacteria bacterium]